MAMSLSFPGITRNALACMTLLAGLAASGLAQAQKPAGLPGNFPSKPVYIAIPVDPGGGTDQLGRLLFTKMGAMWNTPFVVENTPAAGGMVAMNKIAESAPDGHMLAFASSATYLRAAYVSDIVKWDPRTAFVAIAGVSKSTMLLGASMNAPFTNFRELIAYAKAHPNELSYAGTAVGSAGHLVAEQIWNETGVRLRHIPYKGIGAAMGDVIPGRVHLAISAVAALKSHVVAGKLRLMGVTSIERVESAPDFNTLDEAGLKGFDYAGWFGLVGPAKLPPPIVAALNKTTNDILRTPEMKAAMAKMGADQMIATQEYFQKYVVTALDNAGKVIKTLGLKLGGE